MDCSICYKFPAIQKIADYFQRDGAQLGLAGAGFATELGKNSSGNPSANTPAQPPMSS